MRWINILRHSCLSFWTVSLLMFRERMLVWILVTCVMHCCPVCRSLSICLSENLNAWMWLLREGEEWRRMGLCVRMGFGWGRGGHDCGECWGHCTCSPQWTHGSEWSVMRVLGVTVLSLWWLAGKTRRISLTVEGGVGDHYFSFDNVIIY